MTASRQTRWILDSAATLIERTDWGRGGGAGPPYCVATAVAQITGAWDSTIPRDERVANYERFSLAMDEMADRIRRSGYTTDDPGADALHDVIVWHWNDDPERTESDVVRMMRGETLR